MKMYVIKMVALLLFTSMAISSCSVEYRERRAHRNDPNWHGNGHNDDHHDDHHNDNDHH
jgi:hypothetical protein